MGRQAKIQTTPQLEGKLLEYYKLKSNDLKQLSGREQELVESEQGKVERLNELIDEIDNLANELGLVFDPDTGKLTTVGDISQTKIKRPEIDRLSTSFADEKDEYDEISSELNGNENDTDPDTGEKESEPVRQVMFEQKRELCKRDANAKKILEERAMLEQTKDDMDFDAARHVVEKNKILFQIEELKLEIMRKLSSGMKMTDMSVEACAVQIEGLTEKMQKLEVEFANRREGFATKLEGCRTALDNAQKQAMLERENAGDGKNKYRRFLTYSEDGILNGTKTEMLRDGRTVMEEEVFDEKGVIVYDAADLLSRKKTINIDGTVVTCVASFDENNINDKYLIGEEVRLDIEANEKTDMIKDMPNADEDLHEQEAEPAKINYMDKKIKEVIYLINGERYTPEMIRQLEGQLKNNVGRAFQMIGVDAQGIENLRNLVNDIAIDKSKENELEDDLEILNKPTEDD